MYPSILALTLSQFTHTKAKQTQRPPPSFASLFNGSAGIQNLLKVDGQVNLRDAARRDISFVSPDTGKHYGLADGAKLAVLLVRPRGWHLDEMHVTVDGR